MINAQFLVDGTGEGSGCRKQRIQVSEIGDSAWTLVMTECSPGNEESKRHLVLSVRRKQKQWGKCDKQCRSGLGREKIQN